ncbi:MAG: hypothetical protein GY841_05980 [FCB group bacterium]|nr:hypothetical protein [FCB group bacterium]
MKKVIVALMMTGLFWPTGSVFAGNISENISLKGDFRYRHEMIDKEDKDPRHRQRIRARIGIEGKVSSATSVTVQLATGSDDPVSTNQTLDGSFSTKNIGLDLAYLKIKPEQVSGLTIMGGKFKNPFYKPGKSELIWDSDFNPEGGIASFTKKTDDLSFTLIGAGLWIDERSTGDDSWMGAGQGLVKYDLEDSKIAFTLGGGYFNYVNTQGFGIFHDASDPMGNSASTYVSSDETDTFLVYDNDYELFEFFAEMSTELSEMPVTVMFDYVTNNAADSLGDGWLAGIRLGKIKNPGSRSLRYIYREVKKDAVLGTFTDSDFRGGGTDAKGHEFGGTLRLDTNTDFSITYFANKTGLEGAESNYGRLQVDLQLKFK